MQLPRTTQATAPASADEDLDARIAEAAARLEPRFRLTFLVALGIVLITSIGLVLFLWVAWIESKQPFSWWHWMGSVDGDAWFDAARTSATFLAIIGVGGAAVVAYRKQQTAELTRYLEQRKLLTAQKTQLTAAKQARTAAKQANTAARQLRLDSKKFQLDREMQQADRERAMREQFSTVVSQLDTESATIQNAGLFALVALADDWAAVGNSTELLVCIDMFCAHVRAASEAKNAGSRTDGGRRQRAAVIVLRTCASLIRRQLAKGTGNWSDAGTVYDLSRVDLSGHDLHDCDLRGVDFSSANLSNANLRDCDLRRANLDSAVLDEAYLDGSDMSSASARSASLKKAGLSGARCLESDFGGADLSGSWIKGADFTRAEFALSNLVDVKYSQYTSSYTPQLNDLPTFTETYNLHQSEHAVDFATTFDEQIRWSLYNSGEFD